MRYRLISGETRRGGGEAGEAEVVSRRRRAAQRTVAVLPTLFTLGNLLCGFAAIFLASRAADAALPFGLSPLTIAAMFIFLGMAFDGIDGHVARMTRSTSDLGEQLDSMADMVTFGVAPAFLVVQLVSQLTTFETPFLSMKQDLFFGRATLIIACIYVACAALRLARFNAELHSPREADHSGFNGLPSPGAAGAVASLILLHQHTVAAIIVSQWSARTSALAMVPIMLLAALAMVSRLRYAHLANRYLRGRAGIGRIAKLVVVVLLLSMWPQVSLAAGFTIYALSAPVVALYRLITGQPGPLLAEPDTQAADGAEADAADTLDADDDHDQRPTGS